MLKIFKVIAFSNRFFQTICYIINIIRQDKSSLPFLPKISGMLVTSITNLPTSFKQFAMCRLNEKNKYPLKKSNQTAEQSSKIGDHLQFLFGYREDHFLQLLQGE